MESRRRRIVAVAAVMALAATGGGVAYAAATGTGDRDALLNDAAQRLNVSPGELRAALEGAFGERLDEAVRAGRLTQEQADRIEAQVRRFGLPLGGPLGGHDRREMRLGGPGHGPFGAGLDAAADHLGLTTAQLARRLTNGRSLAEVARAEGRSVDGLEQALVEEARSRLDRAVSDRALTSDERDRLLREIEQRVEDLVSGRAPGPGFAFGHHERHGRGGPGGPPPLGGFPGHP